MIKRLLILSAIAFAHAGGCATAETTQTSESASETAWQAGCMALARADFSRIQDAPAQVLTAKSVEATDNLPAHCEVEAYVTPHIGIQLKLPALVWNGKFLMVGCGGFCGVALAVGCNDPLRRGYACIASDLGHKSTLFDGKWAYNNLQAEIDYGFRATHVGALAGKAITEHFYEQQPKHSYYMGCSTGGRQGLIEAQQFPWDFDGIISGAPVVSLSNMAMNVLWNLRAASKTDGRPLFDARDLELVHRAIIAQCDAHDDLEDGVIGEPTQCKFDPGKLTCPADTKAGCLSRQQTVALRKLYAGPTTSRGERIGPGNVMPGSELAFTNFTRPSTDEFSRDFFRYLAFMPDPDITWQADHFNFDSDYKRLGMMERLHGASNPDLRRFKDAGGKLILYHGWNDVAVSPLMTIDYYETVVRTLGGRAVTDEFLRLFMIPGMNHCYGGDGASVIDMLSYLEAWVEKGQAPTVLMSAHLKNDSPGHLRFPLEPTNISFTRPVYPYPVVVRYSGTGDPNDATNFRAVEP